MDNPRYPHSYGATYDNLHNRYAEPGKGEWTTYIHPDGWHYYYHAKRRIVTDSKVQAEQLTGKKSESKENEDSTTFCETVYLIQSEDGFLKPVQIVLDHAKKRAQIEGKTITDLNSQAEYWKAMSFFPSHRKLSADIEPMVKQALHCYVMNGNRNGEQTSAPFVAKECRHILKDLEEFENNSKNSPDPITSDSSPRNLIPFPLHAKQALMAWIMLHTCYQQLDLQPESAKAERPNLLFEAFSLICFGVPLAHLSHVREGARSLRRNSIPKFTRYMKQVVDECEGLILAATVLLSASVSFLAAPGLDSVARIASLLSVVLTLGSILSGLFLVWRHKDRENPEGIQIMFDSFKGPAHWQHHVLAVILSVPFVMLAWGVISFLVAIILYSFFGFQTSRKGINTRLSRGTAYTVLASSVGFLLVFTAIVGFFVFYRHHHPRLSGGHSTA